MILCPGELLADVVPDAREFPGGAPANVAYHAAALGMRSVLVSRVGGDVRGRRLRDWLGAGGVETDALQMDAEVATGMVTVTLSGGIPVYDIAAPAAWDFIAESPEALAAARTARVAVFGTLAQRHPVSRAALRGILETARGAGATLVADVNLRPPFFDEDVVLWSLRHCDVLKLNDGELETVSAMLGARGDRMELLGGLLREFGLRRGVLTCGAGGAWFCEDGVVWHVPAVPAEVADTVGAGDAFTAVMASFLALGLSLRDAGPWCAEVAAAVVVEAGATPALPAGLRTRVQGALGLGS